MVVDRCPGREGVLYESPQRVERLFRAFLLFLKVVDKQRTGAGREAIRQALSRREGGNKSVAAPGKGPDNLDDESSVA